MIRKQPTTTEPDPGAASPETDGEAGAPPEPQPNPERPSEGAGAGESERAGDAVPEDAARADARLDERRGDAARPTDGGTAADTHRVPARDSESDARLEDATTGPERRSAEP